MEITSGKLQDIEVAIRMLKEEGKIGEFFHRLAVPWMMFTPKEKWSRILEFEKKQELDKLNFMEELKIEVV